MITDIEISKCTGCGTCVSHCNMDVLRLNTAQKELPLCQAACPAGVDTRSYINALKYGNPEEAMRIIREAHPFPSITGRVCFHPCEKQCARNEVDEAVNINSLERFAGDYWLKERAEPAPRQHLGKVAVIGSGPAGLSCAYYLAKMGYPVTVFEAASEFGGMLRSGIGEYRLPRKILDAQINYLMDLGIEFTANSTFGIDLKINGLRDSGYKAIFLAIGNQLSSKIAIEGSDLDGVEWGLDFLKAANAKRHTEIKGKVIVIGGGDVAVDCVLSAMRLGAESVELICLESKDQMPAHEEGLKQALEEGASLNTSRGPKRVLGKHGRVCGVELMRCNSVYDGQGAFCPAYAEKHTEVVNADRVIFAIGQKLDSSFLPAGLEITKRGTILSEEASFQTSLAGVFAGGDAVNGPSSVPAAACSGRLAALSIDRYLRGEANTKGVAPETMTVTRSPKEGIPRKARAGTQYLPVNKRRNNFKEIKYGFDRETALYEAQRCMTCGSKSYIAYNEDCMTCFECALNCPEKAISVSFSPGFVTPSIDLLYDEVINDA